MATNTKNREYELKFRAEPGDLVRFKSAVDAIDTAGGDWSVVQLHSRYYDTPDRRLQKMGTSLRVRKSNKGSVLTVKANAGNGDGVIDRWEWEHAISGTELDLAVLPPEAWGALDGVTVDDLGPIIDVSLERHAKIVHRVDPLGPTIVAEAVADNGRVTAGGGSEDVTECELEMKSGNLGSFFALAADIIEACPLPMSSITKAGRGYRLLAGTVPAPRKMVKFDMSGDLTVHQCLEQIFSACIGNITANEEACIRGDDPEGVHQMRVSIRKLRSALKTFRRFIDPAHKAWMNVDLKWIGNGLGPARDWDVFLDETLPSMAALGIDAKAIEALRQEGYTNADKPMTACAKPCAASAMPR
jgi:triphosphatase